MQTKLKSFEFALCNQTPQSIDSHQRDNGVQPKTVSQATGCNCRNASGGRWKWSNKVEKSSAVGLSKVCTPAANLLADWRQNEWKKSSTRHAPSFSIRYDVAGLASGAVSSRLIIVSSSFHTFLFHFSTSWRIFSRSKPESGLLPLSAFNGTDNAPLPLLHAFFRPENFCLF